jgi:hypothetical protein
MSVTQTSPTHKYLQIGKKLPPVISAIDENQKVEIRSALQHDKSFIKFCDAKTDWTHTEHDYLKNILEIPKNDYGYYIDIYGERVSYNGIRTLKRAKTVLDLSPIHKNEIRKCKESFSYFREHYCLITTKTGLARPEPREYQVNLEENLITLEDCVILYPRQSGKTVTSGNYLLWRAIFHEDAINIGIVANKPATAAEVLSKMKKTFIELPIWLQSNVTIWNMGNIAFDNGTNIMTDGPSSDSFRGYTINILYIDEVAYLKKSLWEEFTDSVMPTMNSLIFKQVIMTSTANGVNHFKHIVDAAKKKDSPERYITTSWRNVPHYNKAGKLLAPAEYKKITIKRYGKKYFAQTEECEFLGSSDTLISGEALRDIQDNVENVKPIPQAVLNDGEMYKQPVPGHNYIISVDPSKDGIDEFSVDVTDVSQFPFEQVFTANLQVDYLIMPEHLYELGKYYNNGLMIIENNEGAGQSITDTLWNVYEYENIYRDKNIDGKVGFKRYTGFRTTIKSRALVLNLLKIFIDEGKLIVNSKATLEQFYTFTKRKTGNKYEAEDGYKDDAVMSLAIMFAPFVENKTFDDYKMFVKELKIEESTQTTSEFLSSIDVGFSSDEDGVDESVRQMRATAQMLKESGQEEYAPFDPSAFSDMNHHGGMW